MNLKRLLFCAMLVLMMSLNVVNVQADALDYLGSTIDGSVLTNDLESSGTYQQEVRICIRDLLELQITGMDTLELPLEQNAMLAAIR